MKARSVPALRVTSYCSGVSCSRHSCSDFSNFSALLQVRRSYSRPEYAPCVTGAVPAVWRQRGRCDACSRSPRSPPLAAAPLAAPPPAPAALERLIAPGLGLPGPDRPRRRRRRPGAGDALHDQLRPPRSAASASSRDARRARPLRRAASPPTSSAATASATKPAAATSPTGCSGSATSRRAAGGPARTSPGAPARSAPCARSSAPGCTRPGHRENILGSYGQIGIGLRVGGLDGHGDAHVWTQHFGSTLLSAAPPRP